MESTIRPIEKITLHTPGFVWSRLNNRKINFKNINEGVFSYNSVVPYNYMIVETNESTGIKYTNYFLILDHKLNSKEKFHYIVQRDIWSENIEQMKQLNNVNIVATSKEELIEKNISTVNRIIEPENETNKLKIDSIITSNVEPEFWQKNILLWGNNTFWYDYEDVTLDTFELSKVSQTFIKNRVSKHRFLANILKTNYPIDQLLRIFNSWKNTLITGYSSYETKILKLEKLLSDFKNKGYYAYEFNKSPAFNSKTRGYKVLAVEKTNINLTAVSTNTDPIDNKNINCEVGELDFDGFYDDKLDKINPKISIVNIDYKNYNSRSRGNPSSVRNYDVLPPQNNITYEFLNSENYENIFSNITNDRYQNIYFNDIKLGIRPIFLKYKDFPNNTSYVGFYNRFNNDIVYFDINGKFALVKNQQTTPYVEKINIQNFINNNFLNDEKYKLITKIYSTINIYFKDTIQNLPLFASNINMAKITSSGLIFGDNEENMLLINYDILNSTFQKIMFNTITKSLTKTEQNTPSQLYHLNLQNKIGLNNLQRDINTSTIQKWGGALNAGASSLTGVAAFKNNPIAGALTAATSYISGGVGWIAGNNQVENMKNNFNLQKQQFKRQIQLATKPIITSFNMSNSTFFKKVYNTENLILLSLNTIDENKKIALYNYHKRFGYEILAIENINLNDFKNEFLQLEDNKLIKQMPSNLITDNLYLIEVLKNGIILEDI